MLELLLQTPSPLVQPTPVQAPSLVFLTNALQIIATAVGVGIAAYTLVNTYAGAILKQIKEVKSLTDRNNNSIQNRSEEIKIKTDGLYTFIDRVQKHQSQAIGETNQKISGVEEELKRNTELTGSNSERIAKLERMINSQTIELKESFGEESRKEKD
jgi:hypothetical protein